MKTVLNPIQTIKTAKELMHTFSFAQMCSNTESGKTSASGSMGVYTILIGGLCFLIGAISFIWNENSDIMMWSSALIGTGSVLLGHRKSKEKNTTTTEATMTNKSGEATSLTETQTK